MNKIWFSFARHKRMRYFSHLDMLRLFIRALRRGRFPVVYSQGFNPHPRFSLALPLPLGITADEELGEITFSEKFDAGQFAGLLAEQMPVGLEITGAVCVDENRPPLPSLVEAASYRAGMINEGPENISSLYLEQAVNNLFSKGEIKILKRGKRNKEKEINIRPHIMALSAADKADHPTVAMLLRAGSGGGVSPLIVLEKVIAGMGITEPANIRWDLHRERLYTNADGKLETLSEGMCKIDG
ncbi:MAG: TIGR03936 family radical SAM-associated protein [Bacillota bacterium]|nr:TIGR03936 family radical SAM-associated protein [Bacillota bacterium]